VSAASFVDVHFDNAERSRFTIVASGYSVSVALDHPRVTALRLGNEAAPNLLEGDGIGFEARSRAGTIYSSAQASKPARLNIWRHGPYYHEVHVLDTPLTSAEGRDLPGTAEWIFHCYPEKFHLQAIFRRAGAGGPPEVSLSLPITGLAARASGRVTPGYTSGAPPGRFAPAYLLRGGALALAVLPVRGALEEGGSRPEIRGSGRVSLAFLPAADASAARARVAEEIQPLDAGHFTVLDGGRFTGYDRDAGYYTLRTQLPTLAMGFESFWANPNQYLQIRFRVRGDGRPRRIMIQHDSPFAGTLEAGVLADRYGFPLPVPVQACKNFNGEGEEPDDTAFGETYFPLDVAPDADVERISYHLFQNWGNHPLKQLSSIRYFEHYYHLSTGVTETTCYVPFTKRAYPRTGYTIADFRGISGHTWKEQPQHDHVALIGFLQYREKAALGARRSALGPDKSGLSFVPTERRAPSAQSAAEGGWCQLRYQRSHFDFISPNFARFRMEYVTEDEKMHASVEVFEIPQTDQTRSFVRLRYDVLQPVHLEDARHDLRLLNANTDITRNRYATIGWLDVRNRVQTDDLRYDDTWSVEGEPLGDAHPFVCLYPSEKSNNAFVVRSYQGRVAGEPLSHLALSVIGYKNGVAEQALTLPDRALTLQPGDFIGMDVILMPYGTERSDWHAPERERTYYGSDAPRVTTIAGTRLADFPTDVRVGAEGAAVFETTGGEDALPLIVRGFSAYKAPLLFEFDGQWNFLDQQVRGNDWYQAFRDPDGSCGAVFIVKTRSGQKHRYFAGQATGDAEVTGITQVNGEVRVTAARRGRLRIVSPRAFRGFTHHVTAGSEVVVAEGEARQAVSLPVWLRVERGEGRFTFSEFSPQGAAATVEIAGPATLVLRGLEPDATYRLTLAAGRKTEPATLLTTEHDGTLTAHLERAGAWRVRLTRADIGRS
jgi:hypothetical protein